MELVAAQKSHALSRGELGCVGELATLNVTRGCAARCTFCYARCHPGAPPPGTVGLYQALPSLLRQELDSPRRKRPLPPFVALSTASDAFLGGPAVAATTHACVEIVLNRGLGLSFATRGDIPPETLRALARRPERVQVTIPLPSLSPDYVARWEPGTASPRERLFLLQRLQEAGLTPAVRLDPLIPYVNDETESLRKLCSALSALGHTQAMVSFLHLRPGVAEQLHREAPPEALRLLLGAFPSQGSDRPSRFDHLPQRQLLGLLRRVQRIGREQGIRLSACRCQNPGLPAARCPIAPAEGPTPPAEQASLFAGSVDEE